MTYFEWVSAFKNLEDSPMDEGLLKQLEDKKLDGGEYVLYRFVSHVNETMRKRLSNCLNRSVNKILVSDIDVDILSLELINIKKEISFVKKIVQLPVIPSENKAMFKTTLNNFVNEIYETLRNNIKIIDYNGEYISAFEKIMNNGMEE